MNGLIVVMINDYFDENYFHKCFQYFSLIIGINFHRGDDLHVTKGGTNVESAILQRRLCFRYFDHNQ